MATAHLEVPTSLKILGIIEVEVDAKTYMIELRREVASVTRGTRRQEAGDGTRFAKIVWGLNYV